MNRPKYKYTHLEPDSGKYYIEGFGNVKLGDAPVSRQALSDHIDKLYDAGQLDNNDSKFTTEDLLKNKGLHEAYKTFHRRYEGKEFEGSTQELVDSYKQDMRDHNWNLFKLSSLSFNINDYTAEEKMAYTIMDNTWQKTAGILDGDEIVGGLVDISQSLMTDPTNLVNAASLGAGIIAGTAARAVGKKALGEAIKEYSKVGIVQGAINGSVFAGVDDNLRQSIEGELYGMDEHDWARTAKALALGGTIGGLIGGGVGAVMGKSTTTKQIKKELGVDKKLGPDGKIQKLTDKQQATAEKLVSDESASNAANYAKTMLRLTFEKQQKQIGGKELKKARLEASKKFEDNISEQSQRYLEGTGLLDFGFKKENYTQQFTHMKDFINALKITDVTDVATMAKKMRQPKGKLAQMLSQDKYQISRDIFGKMLADESLFAYKQALKSKDPSLDINVIKRNLFEAIKLDKDFGSSAGQRLGIRKGGNTYPGQSWIENQFKAGKSEFDSDVFDNFTTQADWHEKIAHFDDISQVKRYIKHSDNVVARNALLTSKIAHELFIHNILGGISTVVVNTLGSAAHVIDRGAMRYVGGVLSGNKQMRIGAMSEMMNLGTNLNHALKNSIKAMNESKNILDDRWMRDDFNPNEINIGTKESVIYEKGSIPFKNWWTDGAEAGGIKGAGGGLVNAFGNALRLVGRRGILGTDEFVKQLSFRSYAQNLAFQETIRLGKKDVTKMSRKEIMETIRESSKKADEAVEDQLFSVAEGIESNNYITKSSIEEARTAVYQDDPFQYKGQGMIGAGGVSLDIPLATSRYLNELKRGSIGESKILDFIVPFVRTPANLISYTFERTPVLQMFSEKFGAKVAKGGQEAAQAHAALNAGIMLWSSSLLWAMNNMVEGSGAKDRGQQAVREKTLGIPRHSFVVNAETGERALYRKLDPYAGFLRIMGNMLDVYKYGDKKATTDYFAAGALSAAASFLDMPTLTGVRTAVEAFDTDGSRAMTYLGKQVGSMIPFYRLHQEAMNNERSYAEVTGFQDNIAAKFYGLKDDSLDRQRDPVFGYERFYAADYPFFLSPIESVTETGIDDPLMKELKRLKFSIQNPERKRSGIDLKKIKSSDYGGKSKRSLYDEWQASIGEIKVYSSLSNKKITLEDRLREEVDTNDYRAQSESTRGYQQSRPGGKDKRIRGIIAEYRNTALLKLYKKYPDFYYNVINPNKMIAPVRTREGKKTTKEKIESMKR